MNAPQNSFKAPIVSMWNSLSDLEWEFPFIQVAIAAISILVVLGVLVVLYPTVGVFLQIAEVLAIVTNEAYKRLQKAESFEIIGHATAVGVMFLFYLPFAIVGWPLFGIATLARRLFAKLERMLEEIPGRRE